MRNSSIIIKLAEDSKDFMDGKAIILEYVEWLGMDLSFQNFDNEINNLSEMYSKPNGGLFLAIVNEAVVGVVGVRKFEGKHCELKRMFVKEGLRNFGIGRMLLMSAINLAKKLNYDIMKLDTSATMKPAIKLYQDNGFVELPTYRYNPHESAKYFELKLHQGKPDF